MENGGHSMYKCISHKAITLKITTYKELNSKGKELVSLLEDFFNYFQEYIHTDTEIDLELMNGREKIMNLNNKNLSKIYDLFLQGKVHCLQIASPPDVEYPDKSSYSEEEILLHIPSGCTLAVVCNLAATYPPSNNVFFPNDLCISLSDQLFGGYIPADVQRKFVLLFQNAVHLLEADTGYITYESKVVRPTMKSTFEDYWGIDIILHHFSTRLHGYFWANYLSKQHIATLGGLELIKDSAPCDIIEPVIHSNKPGVFLQLTDNINSYSDDQLVKLRNYFWPLLDVESIKFEAYNGEPRFREFTPGYIARLVEPPY
ncbi:hypothetical protein D3C76_337750 [compost metagenome]